MIEKNKMHLADCMDIMCKMPDKYIDLSIVDPPYGIGRFKKGGSHINKYGSEQKNWNNEKPDKLYFKELFRISKSAIIWGANNFEGLPSTEYFLIWQKGNAMDFSFAMCEYAWTNCKKPAKIFKRLHVQEGETRIHPTQKPIALYRWILQNYAKPGQLIFDSHSGSGSCAIACYLEGFDFIACELDADYHRDSVKRFEEIKSQGRLFI